MATSARQGCFPVTTGKDSKWAYCRDSELPSMVFVFFAEQRQSDLISWKGGQRDWLLCRWESKGGSTIITAPNKRELTRETEQLPGIWRVWLRSETMNVQCNPSSWFCNSLHFCLDLCDKVGKFSSSISTGMITALLQVNALSFSGLFHVFI